MPVYKYKGFTSKGRPKNGSIEADSIADATKILKGKAIYPTVINEDSELQRPLFRVTNKAVNLEQITRQLAILATSGVPIIDGIKVLAEEEKGVIKKVLVGIRERLAEGADLARTLADFPTIFPPFYINMVEAGQAGGRLGEVLENLSVFLETTEELKSRIKTAAVYPIFMLMVGTVVLFFVFVYVVPKITKIFADSGHPLPFITKVLITLSTFMQNYWWLLILILLTAIYFIKVLYKKHEKTFGILLNRIPILNTLYCARFMKTTGFLLESGVPMLKTLKLSSLAIGNKYLECHVLECEKKVAEGAPLSFSLTAFSPLLRQIIQTGQKSGKLPQMLLKAADSYEKNFQEQVRRYLNYLEPTMILIMGLIVGFIVFSVLMPIFELNQLIK